MFTHSLSFLYYHNHHRHHILLPTTPNDADTSLSPHLRDVGSSNTTSASSEARMKPQPPLPFPKECGLLLVAGRRNWGVRDVLLCNAYAGLFIYLKQVFRWVSFFNCPPLSTSSHIHRYIAWHITPGIIGNPFVIHNSHVDLQVSFILQLSMAVHLIAHSQVYDMACHTRHHWRSIWCLWLLVPPSSHHRRCGRVITPRALKLELQVIFFGIFNTATTT